MLKCLAARGPSENLAAEFQSLFSETGDRMEAGQLPERQRAA